MKIIFSDDKMLIVEKPSGLPSHATLDPRRAHLLGELEKALRLEPGSLLLVHRLDASAPRLLLHAHSLRFKHPAN